MVKLESNHQTKTWQDARGLSPEDSDALMQELSSLFKVMSERGNGAALDRPFSSPYHWAGFQVTRRGGRAESERVIGGA